MIPSCNEYTVVICQQCLKKFINRVVTRKCKNKKFCEECIKERNRRYQRKYCVKSKEIKFKGFETADKHYGRDDMKIAWDQSNEIGY